MRRGARSVHRRSRRTPGEGPVRQPPRRRGCARAPSTRSSASSTCSSPVPPAPPGRRGRVRPRGALLGHPLGPAGHRQDHPWRTSSPRPPTSASWSCRRSPRASRRSARSSTAPAAVGGYGKETVLFLDEIHRFSKAQQDSLLPAVENRWVTLIAATTENPYFSVISPLLSRSLLLTLEPLTDDDVRGLLRRALSRRSAGSGTPCALPEDTEEHLLRIAGGDARRALTALEAAAGAALDQGETEISLTTLEETVDRAAVKLRPRRRPALRRRQRPDQVHPRLRRRRRACTTWPG